MLQFTEPVVEEAALAWLEALGDAVLHGPDIATRMLAAERTNGASRSLTPSTGAGAPA